MLTTGKVDADRSITCPVLTMMKGSADNAGPTTAIVPPTGDVNLLSAELYTSYAPTNNDKISQHDTIILT